MLIEELGRTVTTRGVFELRETNDDFKTFISDCLVRYMQHDWGELAEEDKKMNDQALKSGEDRIFASYIFPEGASFGGPENKLWIITEWDRSVTTLLFPSEY